jgi:hypothetical protein
MNIIDEPMSQFRKPIAYRKRNGCWICVSHRPARNGKGVPQVMRDGKFMTVASYVYSLVHGPFEGKIKHTCGNRLCINPDHVVLEETNETKR